MIPAIFGGFMDIVKEAQKQVRIEIIRFIIETVLMILSIFLVFLWFDWKLFVILFVWQFYANVSNRDKRRG